MEIVLSGFKNNVLPIAKEGVIHLGHLLFALIGAFLGGRKGVLEDCFSRPVPGSSDTTVDEQFLGLIFINIYVTQRIQRTIKVSLDVKKLQNTRNKLEGDLYTYKMRFNEVTSYSWRSELSHFITMIETYLKQVDNKLLEISEGKFENYLSIDPTLIKPKILQILEENDKSTVISQAIMIQALRELNILSYEIEISKQKQKRLVAIGLLFYDFLDLSRDNKHDPETHRKFQEKKHRAKIEFYKLCLIKELNLPLV